MGQNEYTKAGKCHKNKSWWTAAKMLSGHKLLGDATSSSHDMSTSTLTEYTKAVKCRNKESWSCSATKNLSAFLSRVILRACSPYVFFTSPLTESQKWLSVATSKVDDLVQPIDSCGKVSQQTRTDNNVQRQVWRTFLAQFHELNNKGAIRLALSPALPLVRFAPAWWRDIRA